jgi:hypothetical protein
MIRKIRIPRSTIVVEERGLKAEMEHNAVLRTRNTAAANEAKDILRIIRDINDQTPTGHAIISAFKEKFGLDIAAARMRKGSSRGTHYDFEIQVNEEWKKVEHKGSQTYRIPNPDDDPWKAAVQFYNGGCEKFSIATKYARVWYTMYIQSGLLTEEFGIEAPIPEFDEWFEKDCRVQSDPKTPFGKELKSKVRLLRGPRSSLLEKRGPVLQALEITEHDKHVLITEVLAIANHVLEQKEYWLSIHGNLDGTFHATWYPQFRIDSIQEVVIKKNLDLELSFVCVSGFSFHGILRWGKGAGFSCLRMDLK